MQLLQPPPVIRVNVADLYTAASGAHTPLPPPLPLL